MLSTDHPQLSPTPLPLESGFQSSKPPTSLDTSRLGCAARFNLSAMDLPVSMNGRFQVSPAAGQLLPSARTADLSKDKEIFDSDDDDNDLPSVKQILASSKRPKQVIDLTGDDDDDREGDEGDFIEVSWLQNHPNGSTARKTNSTLLDRPHPGRRPTPFPFHHTLCQNHRYTPPTTLHRRLQRPHPVGRNTLGLIPLRGLSYTTNFNGILTSLLTTRWLTRYTPARTVLSPPQSSSSLRRRSLELP